MGGVTGLAKVGQSIFDVPGSWLWRFDLACRGEDPELFFPEGSGASTQEAKAICHRCPAEDQCREWALSQSPYQLYGVWGGTSHYDRQVASGRRPR